MAFVEATVLLFKCDRSQSSYGVRVEKSSDGDWWRTWAFPVDFKQEKNENYAQQKVVGNFNFTEEFEGCPHCGGYGFMACGGCGKISCWREDLTNPVTCQWCGVKCEVSTSTDKFDASGSSF